jgi:hypothetical protein
LKPLGTERIDGTEVVLTWPQIPHAGDQTFVYGNQIWFAGTDEELAVDIMLEPADVIGQLN